jgi:hypothetical protein
LEAVALSTEAVMPIELPRGTVLLEVVAEVLKLAVAGGVVAVGVGVGGSGVGVGGTGVLVGSGVAVGVGVLVGAAEVTENAPALPFQLKSVPHPGEKTPTATAYGPLVAVVGTDHELANVRVWPALNVWLSQACWKTFVPAGS